MFLNYLVTLNLLFVSTVHCTADTSCSEAAQVTVLSCVCMFCLSKQFKLFPVVLELRERHVLSLKVGCWFTFKGLNHDLVLRLVCLCLRNKPNTFYLI